MLAEVLFFILRRICTRVFWGYVVVTFVGVVMIGARNQLRNQIFEAARNTLGK